MATGGASEHENGGKLIWIPSSVALTDTANSLTGANYAYTTEMLNWMSPRDTILSSVDAISMDDPMLTVTAGAAQEYRFTVIKGFIVELDFEYLKVDVYFFKA